MKNSVLIKRLANIKLLYKLGVDLSYQNETTAHFSILPLHDCIEMFLKLAADEKNIDTSKQFGFLSYWDKIPELTLKGQMQALNNARNNLKHKGLTPGKVEIESARVYATDFLKENSPLLFGINFSEISLFDLIVFEKTKQFLVSAKKALDENQIEKCIDEVTKGFYELLEEYKSTKKGWYDKSHFDFIEKIRPPSKRHEITETEREIIKSIDKINKNFENIANALEVVSLGIDFRKYVKFRILTPIVHKFPNGKYQLEIMGEKNWSKENCEFLIDFVLDSCLKLQEFDFNINSLDTTQPLILEALLDSFRERFKNKKPDP